MKPTEVASAAGKQEAMMPVRRRKIQRRSTLKVSDLGVRDYFDMALGWRPPKGEFEKSRSSWLTEDEFLDHYELVRHDFLNNQQHGPPFAEKLWQKRRGNR